MQKPKDPILIADTDLDYISSLRVDPQAQQFPPILNTNVKDVSENLSQAKRSYSAIVLSPDLAAPNSVPLIRLALKHLPAVPIFYLANKSAVGLSAKDLECLTIRKVIVKPASYSEIVRTVEGTRPLFDADAAIRIANDNLDRLDSDSQDEESSFVPILARQFLSGSTSLFDLYVRLGKNRFLKILQAGDAFDAARVNEYLKKGIDNFYLRKEAQENYLRYCDHLSAVTVNKPGIPENVKAGFVLNYGEETMRFLSQSGVTPASIDYARQYVDRTRDLAERISGQNGSQLRGILSDAMAFEHGVGLTMIGALLAEELKFQSDKTVQTVGLACLLHDIGLQGESEVLRDEDEAKMTAEERARYRLHPLKGAKLLEAVKGIDPTVIQAVLQHHERRDRLGFPHQLGANSINRVSEIVGISDEFIRLLHLASQNPHLDPLEQMKLKVFPLFSAGVVEAFRARFCTKVGSRE